MPNAYAAASDAYGRLDARMVDPMRAEALVFARVTRRLERVSADPDMPFSSRAEVLNDNRRLWVAVAAAVADEANGMPDTLRAQLLSLAGFVERLTGTLLRGEGEVATLVEINRRVAGGLTQGGR